MPAVILDACGILNLYASGHFVSILTAVRNDWYLPSAVEKESQQYRQPDPSDPEKLIVQPIDLVPVVTDGILTRCDCESEEESELYIELAARTRDDGESMGLAIAKCRGWSVLTDDKKARRIARELGVVVIATSKVMKQWSDIVKPTPAELAIALEGIERFARYLPSQKDENFTWWVDSIQAKWK